MRYYLLLLALLLVPAIGLAAVAPTTMRVVDLRGITGQPELETWLGSLQGTLNRQDTSTIVYLIRNETDAALAASLIAMYGLQRETFTPGALLATVKASLTGQVRYTPAQPWTRNIALTAAAVAAGAVIATDTDLGLPTVLDLRDRWPDRRRAYEWAVQEYGAKTEAQTVALAPESGHLLADLIAARKLLAVDLSPTDPAEQTALLQLIQRLPTGGRLLGSVDDRAGDAATGLWSLTRLLGDLDRAVVPTRDVANLSCLARLPVTRPLRQERLEAHLAEVASNVIFIYDGGRPLSGGQSLDYAARFLPEFLTDPALASLPVGIETPVTLLEYAPALYQLLIARQRDTAAELIAAPNGDGWALPMALRDPARYLQYSAQRAAAADLTSLSFFDVGGKEAYDIFLAGLAARGWRGAFAYPVAIEALQDKQVRNAAVLPQFTGLVGVSRASNVGELRTILARLQGPFNVIYLDPFGVPPGLLRDLLPEIAAEHSLLTPAQALRAIAEYVAVMPWLQAKQQRGVKNPSRDEPTLKVATPTTTLTAPTADAAIPISVRIEGKAPVLVARLIYTTPRGRVGTEDLLPAGDGVWAATLPPTLRGGPLTIRARVVESGGFGITGSPSLTLAIPVVDSDEDGLHDTEEAYLGTDPKNWDTDHDGLADGYDPDPLRANRDTHAFMPPIVPPADRPWLADAGASTANEKGRQVPAGGAISYRLTLQDIPATPGAVRLVATGAGAVSLNGGEPVPLATLADGAAATDVPVTAEQMAGKSLLVTLTAGEQPLVLHALRLTNNPHGPYLFSPELSPTYPPAGVPILVTATAYTTKPLKAVRLHYGTDLKNLKTIAMGRLEGTANALFAEYLPEQQGGTVLLYNVEAEDTEGNISATPFHAMPIGLTRRSSMALIGTRDLHGSWRATPIWGDYGRSLVQGAGEDKVNVYPRPGKHAAWLLAQPIERAIRVKFVRKGTLRVAEATLLDTTIPAGNASGWYYLGSFSMKEAMGVDITVAPVGEAGYCAYGMVVVTQDEQFKPPLAHAGLDWFNTIAITGIANGDIVRDAIKLRVLGSGNIDALRVTAKQKTWTAGVYSGDEHVLQKQPDGQYMLSTRRLPPGEYEVTATGLKVVKMADGKMASQPVVSATVRVTVPK